MTIHNPFNSIFYLKLNIYIYIYKEKVIMMPHFLDSSILIIETHWILFILVWFFYTPNEWDEIENNIKGELIFKHVLIHMYI